MSITHRISDAKTDYIKVCCSDNWYYYFLTYEGYDQPTIHFSKDNKSQVGTHYQSQVNCEACILNQKMEKACD